MTETPTHLVLWLSHSSCACKSHLTSQNVSKRERTRPRYRCESCFGWSTLNNLQNLHPCLWFSTLPVSAEHSQDKGDQIKFKTDSRELVVTHTHKLRWVMSEVWLLSLSVDAIWRHKLQHAEVWGGLGRKHATSATSPPKPTSWTCGHGKCWRLIVSRLTWCKQYQNAILPTFVHTDSDTNLLRMVIANSEVEDSGRYRKCKKHLGTSKDWTRFPEENQNSTCRLWA